MSGLIGTKEKHIISRALLQHSVIIVPGINKHRAKCYCGWIDQQPMKTTIRQSVIAHQTDAIIDAIEESSTNA